SWSPGRRRSPPSAPSGPSVWGSSDLRLRDVDQKVLDHRVGEEPDACRPHDGLGSPGVGSLHNELDALANPDVVNIGKPEGGKGTLDRLTLRVGDAVLGHDIHGYRETNQLQAPPPLDLPAGPAG